MEFLADMPNLDQQFNAPTKPDVPLRKTLEIMANDIIDLAHIQFEDDENWLCESSNQTVNLAEWLHNKAHQDDSVAELPARCDFKSDTTHQKTTIDSRTFTRPKKRYNRPSIEKYNEELYGPNDATIVLKKLTDSGIQMNSSSDSSPSNLVFDLAQPTSSNYCFDNILANAPLHDLFTNMSPPSLVNSMCSSTFANLMENSYIKNDPELNVIRNTDFTETILLQDTEPIMFQSITGSCSSLNSDVPENFLKKISQDNNTMTKDLLIKDLGEESLPNLLSDDSLENFKENKVENYNMTYQRRSKNLKSSNTFRVSDESTNGTSNLTFQRRKGKSPVISDNNDQTFCANETKRLLDKRPMQPSMDLNRLSYNLEQYDNKRNSFGSSTDSAENLDSSVSSCGSSQKMLSIDGLNHIVEMQERSLGPSVKQISSTPKTAVAVAKPTLWENSFISPISGRNSSDPELSTANEKVEFKKPLLPMTPSQITRQKSLGQLTGRLAQPKSILNEIDRFGAIRGSHPNLKTVTAPTKKLPMKAPPTASNLNSMGRTLKGSYTSLKPTNANLPVAPPLEGCLAGPKTMDVTHVVGNAKQCNETQVIKPQRTSGLPRPVSGAGTGIPRPVTRIPGPRTMRTIPKTLQSRQTSYQ